MLCSGCKTLDFNVTIPKHENRLFTVLHKSHASFDQSVGLGCDFCLLVSNNLGGNEAPNDVCDQLGAFIVLSCSSGAVQTRESRPDAITIVSRLGTAFLDVIDPAPGDSSIIHPDTTPSTSQSHHQPDEHSPEPRAKRQKLNNSPQLPLPAPQIQDPANTSTGSPENLQRAKIWLNQCIKDHPQCRVNDGSQGRVFVPTRLINLKSPDRPFLEETGTKRKGPFVALSYTWGTTERIQTLTTNIESYKKCLPVKKMPKTFANAFQVARSLGYKYLWTDAFCIIQDSKKDTGQEIPKMGNIYQYAEFTIYAQCAENSKAGFFVDRDPRLYRPCKMSILVTANGKSVKKELTLVTTSYGPDHLKPRGWILQEWVLSSRCLIFGRQMAWICSVCEAQETHPVFRPRKAHAEGSTSWGLEKLRSSIYGTSTAVIEPRNPQKLTNHFDLWYQMLEEYGEKKLSYESDIVNAVAGLANLFKEQHHVTFERGLWREDLKFGLAWYVFSIEPRTVSASGKQPSWSWASVGKVRIKYRSWRSTNGPLEDIGCEFVRMEDGPGRSPEETERTIITLRAPVLKAMLSYNANFEATRLRQSMGGPATEFDVTDTREHPRYPALLLDDDTILPVAEVALDRPFDPIHFPKGSNGRPVVGSIVDVECILLHDQRAFSDRRATVLIVMRDEERDVYKRVGLGFVIGKYISWLGLPNVPRPVNSTEEIAAKEIPIKEIRIM